jgi:hypothetical protein
LKTKAAVSTTVVQNGTIIGLVRDWLLMFAQSNVRLRKPMPPIPEPIKFATGFRGATQQRKDSDESIGKTYSGRNCHTIMKMNAPKKMYFCFCATQESRADLCKVSKTAVCMSE